MESKLMPLEETVDDTNEEVTEQTTATERTAKVVVLELAEGAETNRLDYRTNIYVKVEDGVWERLRLVQECTISIGIRGKQYVDTKRYLELPTETEASLFTERFLLENIISTPVSE